MALGKGLDGATAEAWALRRRGHGDTWGVRRGARVAVRGHSGEGVRAGRHGMGAGWHGELGVRVQEGVAWQHDYG